MSQTLLWHNNDGIARSLAGDTFPSVIQKEVKAIKITYIIRSLFNLDVTQVQQIKFFF